MILNCPDDGPDPKSCSHPTPYFLEQFKLLLSGVKQEMVFTKRGNEFFFKKEDVKFMSLKIVLLL